MKKQITPQKAVRRFKIIFFIFVIMLGTLLFYHLKNKNHTPVAADRVTTLMDRQLDSLLKDELGEGVEILFRAEVEELPVPKKNDGRNEAYIVFYNNNITKDEIVPGSNHKRQRLADKAEEEINKERETAYYRRVMYKTPDEVETVAIQKMSKDGTEAKVFMKTIYNTNNNVIQKEQ